MRFGADFKKPKKKKKVPKRVNEKYVLNITCLVPGLTTHIEFIGGDGQMLMTCDLKMNEDQQHAYELMREQLKGNNSFSVMVQSYIEGEEMKQVKSEVKDVKAMIVGEKLEDVIEGRLGFEIMRV